MFFIKEVLGTPRSPTCYMILWQTQRQIQSCQLKCLCSLPSKQMLMLGRASTQLGTELPWYPTSPVCDLSLLVHCWESQRCALLVMRGYIYPHALRLRKANVVCLPVASFSISGKPLPLPAIAENCSISWHSKVRALLVSLLHELLWVAVT